MSAIVQLSGESGEFRVPLSAFITMSWQDIHQASIVITEFLEQHPGMTLYMNEDFKTNEIVYQWRSDGDTQGSDSSLRQPGVRQGIRRVEG